MSDEFESCTNCIHSADAEALCILRLCKHAIAETKECYEPKAQPTIEPKKMKRMMAWEAKQKGYTCNDCFLSMQNCHDMSICCEDETGLCDWFEEIADMKEGEDG